MDFISYLKTLKPVDWDKKVTDQWTVKDVVAHMVGWEKESVRVLKDFLKNGKGNPWFINTDGYDEFNAKLVKHYKNYSTRRLIQEWEKYMGEIEALIDRVGEKRLRGRKDMQWLFENTEEGYQGHYSHHLKQIEKVVGGK